MTKAKILVSFIEVESRPIEKYPPDCSISARKRFFKNG